MIQISNIQEKHQTLQLLLHHRHSHWRRPSVSLCLCQNLQLRYSMLQLCNSYITGMLQCVSYVAVRQSVLSFLHLWFLHVHWEVRGQPTVCVDYCLYGNQVAAVGSEVSRLSPLSAAPWRQICVSADFLLLDSDWLQCQVPVLWLANQQGTSPHLSLSVGWLLRKLSCCSRRQTLKAR